MFATDFIQTERSLKERLFSWPWRPLKKFNIITFDRRRKRGKGHTLLTADDILFILELMEEKCGAAYSSEPEIAHLQAKLSIMLEAKSQV